MQREQGGNWVDGGGEDLEEEGWRRGVIWEMCEFFGFLFLFYFYFFFIL
jgi:hypothetical protein